MNVKTYNPNIKRNIAFSAQLIVNSQTASYKERAIISKKEIETLQELVKSYGSKKDTITIDIGTPEAHFYRHHYKTYVVKDYVMTVTTNFDKKQTTHNLNQHLKRDNPIKNYAFFADGFESCSPFEVLKKWLPELQKQNKNKLLKAFKKLLL